MTYRRLLFVITIFIVNISAQPAYEVKDVLNHVREKYNTMHDASASFIQKSSRRFVKNEQTQNGTVKMKRGNKYRVETNNLLLVANGITVWIVMPAQHQVIIDSFKENNHIFSPEKFLSGLPDDFLGKELEEDNGLVKLNLEPKENNAQTRQIKSLTVWINPKTWIVEKIEYTDRSLSRFFITLSDIKLNQELRDDEFEFAPSQGMKIVDQRKLK